MAAGMTGFLGAGGGGITFLRPQSGQGSVPPTFESGAVIRVWQSEQEKVTVLGFGSSGSSIAAATTGFAVGVEEAALPVGPGVG
jgi:hypothetical protein